MKIAAQFIFPMLIAGVLTSASACTPPSTEAPTTPPVTASAPAQKQAPRISVHALERRVHDLVNKERVKHGLATMRWDEALGRIAGKHSRDMAKRDYFGHTSPDGHGLSYRYLQSGYACGITIDGALLRGAENIYRLSPDEAEDPAETIIRGWLDNKIDRKNLLSSPWGREGVGVCVGPDNVLYVTMNFC